MDDYTMDDKVILELTKEEFGVISMSLLFFYANDGAFKNVRTKVSNVPFKDILSALIEKVNKKANALLAKEHE